MQFFPCLEEAERDLSDDRVDAVVKGTDLFPRSPEEDDSNGVSMFSSSVTSQGSPQPTGLDHESQMLLSSLPPVITVMDPKESKVLRIPKALLDITSGLRRYMSDPKRHSQMSVFKFHLCPQTTVKDSKTLNGCPNGKNCNMIHSRHSLDPSLSAQVDVCSLHILTDAASLDDCPYPTHQYSEAGKGSTKIVVFDNISAQHVVMEAGCAYITKGSMFALQEVQHNDNGALKIRPVVSEKLRLCFCPQYDHGYCSRGENCIYIHRVRIRGRFAFSRAGLESPGPVAADSMLPSPGNVIVPMSNPQNAMVLNHQQQQQQQPAAQPILMVPYLPQFPQMPAVAGDHQGHLPTLLMAAPPQGGFLYAPPSAQPYYAPPSAQPSLLYAAGSWGVQAPFGASPGRLYNPGAPTIVNPQYPGVGYMTAVPAIAMPQMQQLAPPSHLANRFPVGGMIYPLQ